MGKKIAERGVSVVPAFRRAGACRKRRADTARLHTWRRTLRTRATHLTHVPLLFIVMRESLFTSYVFLNTLFVQFSLLPCFIHFYVYGLQKREKKKKYCFGFLENGKVALTTFKVFVFRKHMHISRIEGLHRHNCKGCNIPVEFAKYRCRHQFLILFPQQGYAPYRLAKRKIH